MDITLKKRAQAYREAGELALGALINESISDTARIELAKEALLRAGLEAQLPAPVVAEPYVPTAPYVPQPGLKAPAGVRTTTRRSPKKVAKKSRKR